MSELKPCPFCGAGAKVKPAGIGCYAVYCENLHRGVARSSKFQAAAEWNTRAVPDVPELVRYRAGNGYMAGFMEVDENGRYVLYSQAAEIIRSMIPRVNNCGRYIAERNDGTLMYLNHGNTWQGCDNFIAAKDKEIERLKNLIDGDDCPDPDKIDALFRRAEAAEAKLAQYEAQEPVGCASVYIYKGRKNIDLNELGNDAAGELPIGDHKLYASPAPAADLKAENERLREALQDVANLYQPRTPIQRAINIARIALNMETSNDKG